MKKWYEYSDIKALRGSVEVYLEDEGLAPTKDEDETAAAFWARVEKAGLLVRAVELFDEFAEDEAGWIHMPRETKTMFAERIEREGRQAEVERMRNEFSNFGLSLREIQEKLVHHFQPLDGSHTRPWMTPDPWQAGRLFRKKEDQDRLLAEADPDNESDPSADWLVECAKWRREERVALANARRRAGELKAAAAAEEAKAKEAAAQAKSPKKAKSQKKADTAEEEPKIKGKWIVVKSPSGSFENKWVPAAE